ncbi:TniB family NTP-binding protein [Pseudomonas silvicola]|nr:TniB family NTP-binding protein [Pseudomonas silvicola]
MKLKISEKLEPEEISLRKLFIQTSYVKGAWGRLADVHQERIRFGESTGLLLMGPSGAGKSALASRYADAVNAERAVTQQCLPVVYLEMPSSPSKKNMCTALLEALGDVDHAKRRNDSSEVKFLRAVTLIENLKTELVIMDEAQHLIDYSRIDAYEAGDWIKSLMNKAGVSVVLVGMSRLEKLKKANSQFRRRFSATYTIKSFHPEEENWSEFLGVIKILQKHMSVDAVDLLVPDMVQRLYFASNGLMDYLVKVLDRALVLVWEGAFPGISLATLHQAFREEVWLTAPSIRNPFDSSFNFLPLLGADEPFEEVDS